MPFPKLVDLEWQQHCEHPATANQQDCGSCTAASEAPSQNSDVGSGDDDRDQKLSRVKAIL